MQTVMRVFGSLLAIKISQILKDAGYQCQIDRDGPVYWLIQISGEDADLGVAAEVIFDAMGPV